MMMNKVARLTTAGALLAASCGASAMTLSAAVSLDWSNLTLFFVPGTVSYSVSDAYSEAVTFGGVQSTNDWTTPLDAVLTSPSSTAHATATPTSLAASVSGGPLTGQSGYQDGAATRRSGKLNISGNGTLFVTLPVTVTASITDTHAADADGSVYASTNLSVYKNDATGEHVGNSYFTYNFSQYGEQTGIDVSDALVTGISVKDGDVIALYAQAYVFVAGSNTGVVPVPGAAWLLGPALLALGAMRRRAA